MLKIYKENICNLSRIPVNIEKNPCYITATQLVNSDLNYKQTALYEHYRSYNPKTLYDFYNVDSNLKNYSFDCLFLPWIHKSPVTEYKDIAFIQREDTFIQNQIKKIKNLIDSINKNGFKPKLFLDRKGGNITGYFLKGHNGKRFYVVSGNHRIAVLSAMFPNDPIVVVYEEEAFMKSRDKINRGPIHSEYSLEHVNKWPSVQSGFISADVAANILMLYVGE